MGGLLIWHRMSVDFSLVNFANLGSFAKILVSIEFIIPWSQGVIDSTGTKTKQIFSRKYITATKFKELFTLF